MEVKNAKRQLKCIGGGQTVKVLDVDFGYLEPRTESTEEYKQDLGEITALGKAMKEKQQKRADSYIFLHDIGKEFKFDRSNLRKFVVKNKIPTEKLKHPKLGQPCLAITKENAELLLKLKFGG